MTVLASKPALNLRRELAKGAAAYSEQKFYFDGLVTNGTFDSDLTGWTSLVNATWDAGEINCANGGFIQAGVFTGVKTVRLSWGQTVNSGTRSRVRLRSATGGTDVGPHNYYNGTGPQSIEFSTADGLSIWFSVASGNDINFDNISVYETDGTDVIHTMPKGWKPKDVFEDGLLQREGASHDYEVIFDGFDYVVKPTVAPTATTETAVIGVKA
jgi:hypothetical protein